MSIITEQLRCSELQRQLWRRERDGIRLQRREQLHQAEFIFVFARTIFICRRSEFHINPRVPVTLQLCVESFIVIIHNALTCTFFSLKKDTHESDGDFARSLTAVFGRSRHPVFHRARARDFRKLLLCLQHLSKFIRWFFARFTESSHMNYSQSSRYLSDNNKKWTEKTNWGWIEAREKSTKLNQHCMLRDGRSGWAARRARERNIMKEIRHRTKNGGNRQQLLSLCCCYTRKWDDECDAWWF